ncbi:MAG: ABC transporter substrate-binding protein [Opitutaceae bacterium]
MLTLFVLVNSSWGTALETVTVQLKWSHQYQFAGYYMAKEKGYYSEAGLDVAFLEGGPSVNVLDAVLSGDAEFGVGTSDLLLDFAQGKPVVVLGVIYQHSPLAITMKADSPSASLEDLVGKPVFIETHAADLIAMFHRLGMDSEGLDMLESYISIDEFIESEIAATSSYLTDEPYVLTKRKVEHLVFTPRSYGIDFYGDNFFTTQAILNNRKDMVHAFREASIRGWEYAMDHPEEAVDLILKSYSPAKNREHLLFEAQTTQQLMTRLVTPGFMSIERWQHIAETYQEVGMLDAVPSLENFIYDPDHSALKALIHKLFPYLTPIIICLCLVPLYLIYKNLWLQKALTEEKNLTLEQQASENTRQLKLQRQILRDIHDGLGGLINNMSMMSAIAIRDTDENHRQRWLEKIGMTANEGNAEIQTLMNALEDSTMIWGQFIDSLRRSADALFCQEHWNILFKINDVPDKQTLGILEGLSLTRMTRECLNNIVKHSGGSEVQIAVYFSEQSVQIQIIDNGGGFDVKAVESGRGLRNLKHRASELGGAFEIASSAQGTSVSIQLPLPLELQQK